jgi:hypothetical protein
VTEWRECCRTIKGRKHASQCPECARGGCLTCRIKVASGPRKTCTRCYHRHCAAVASGETTWAELESQGKVDKSKAIKKSP